MHDTKRSSTRPGRAWLAAALALAVAAPARAEVSLRERPLERLPDGTVIAGAPPQGWSHVVLLSFPRIDERDTSKLPQMAVKFAQHFGMALVANVVRTPDGGSYRLERIARGHTVREGDGVRVVNSKSQGLGMIGGRVLAGIEQAVAEPREVARYDAGVVFDANAVVLQEGRHVDLVIRHFTWVSARTGRLATAMWFIDPKAPGGPAVVGDDLVWAPAGYRDERPLDVDPSQIVLGIPGPKTFALSGLPGGARAPISPGLRRVAADPAYTPRTLYELALELGRVVRPRSGEKPAAAARGPGAPSTKA